MGNNLYWNVYKSLERELLSLAEVIHIDDGQLDVYSMKIADLLFRTSVEIEAISKELYFREGGTKPDDKNLFFDTDCLDLLESKWSLSKKIVMISSPVFYFKENYNLYLTPLHKASNRGTNSSDWQKAYQAVKHNRVKSLKKGNLKHFIRSLGALFILNIYYQNQSFNLGANNSENLFDASIGSSIFSIILYPFQGIDASGIYKKNEDLEKCVYIIQATNETKEPVRKALEDLDDKILNKAISEMQNELSQITESLKADVLQEKIINSIKRHKEECTIAVAKENAAMLSKVFGAIRYEVVLNINQY